MEGLSLALSKWVFPKFFFWGIMIFTIFRLLRFMIAQYPMLARYKKSLEQYAPLVELMVWVTFLFWVISNSAQNNQLLAVAALALLLYFSFWVSRFMFKGFVAGVIFRFSGRLKINETIQVKGYTGKIIKFRSQTFELETEKGEVIYIPYANALDEVQSKTDNADTIRNHSFSLNAQKGKDIEQLKQEIRSCILQLPWASVKKTPSISPVGEGDESYMLKVTIYSVEREYFHRIEKYVKERFEK